MKSPHRECAPFKVGTTRVSNPVCSPDFRASASVTFQESAFASGVLQDINAFHRYTLHSDSLSRTPSKVVSSALSGLSPEISHLTYLPAYAPFTPSKSGQRLPPTYYRGCWHVVSRGLFCRYRHFLRPCQKKFTTRRPSSFTRRCWVRLAPIAQYSPLLPPVGVWAVSQSQCGRSTSQSGY